MLFKETISSDTLELLKRLMFDSNLNDFTLVGGTALSLLLGHRISVDLDFFTVNSFDVKDLSAHLYRNYNYELDYIATNTIKGESDGIKLDFIAHQYPYLENPYQTEGIRIASMIDLAAMKLNAITTNGTRLKDFVDIAFLSSQFTLNEMLRAYEQKYHASIILGIKSLSYFDDVNIHEPLSFKATKKITWPVIKKQILKMIQKPDQLFKEISH